jgi:transcriptional regulator with XRE-family HTH domain
LPRPGHVSCSVGQIPDAEGGWASVRHMRHIVPLGLDVTWRLITVSTLAICWAHNEGQPKWMQPQPRIFSQDELSGLQEKPDRHSRNSPLATKPIRLASAIFPRCVPARLLMERIGGTLGAIRLQRKLSLREVEERSRIFAQERGDNSYRISASWLGRLEKKQHGLTVNKLIALAHIYGLQPEQLFRSMYPDSLGRDPPPSETTLLSPESGPSPGPYKWASSGSTTTPWNPWFGRAPLFRSIPEDA